MRELEIEGVSRRGRRRTPKSESEAAAAPDLVRRNFTATVPDELWVADITYVPTWEDWLFLAVVVDACSRAVCGWSMRDDLEADVVLDALGMATTRRRPKAGLIHLSVFRYIETFYNPQRRHSALDYLSPLEYEKMLRERSAETVAV
jgi:putative transposase